MRAVAGEAAEVGREAAFEQQQQQQFRSLLSMEREEMLVLMDQMNQQRFRTQQIETGIYKWKARNVGDIRGLPKSFREDLLKNNVDVGRSSEVKRVAAPCGTTKLLLKQRSDGRVIETVGIPVFKEEDGENSNNATSTIKRLTVCVSSQVGCAMRCSFCATGRMGFSRNLLSGEIVDQVLHMEEAFQTRVSHVVFMGMGEPLMNMKNVVRAIRDLNERVGIGERHITVSTVGVPNQLRRLAELRLGAVAVVLWLAATSSSFEREAWGHVLHEHTHTVGEAGRVRRNCPCADARLCEPVSSGAAKVVYGFAVDDSAPHPTILDELTDISVFNEETDEAMCAVRSKENHPHNRNGPRSFIARSACICVYTRAHSILIQSCTHSCLLPRRRISTMSASM